MNEEWKPVPGFEGFYEVSDNGRVRSIDRVVTSSDSRTWTQPGKILTCGEHHNGGYSTVVLCKNNKPRVWLVHRLVAAAFLPNPDDLPEVNHIDGRKRNNPATNLEWVKRQANINHAVSAGLINNKGVLNQQAILSEETVLRARAMRAEGQSSRAIASATGITRRNLQNILSRTSWKHI